MEKPLNNLMIVDPGFLRKLKAFDPLLDCVFYKHLERWVIRGFDQYGRCVQPYLLILEDEKTKEAKPFGDWVLNVLHVWRQRAMERDHNIDAYVRKQEAEEQRQREYIEKCVSDDHQAQLKDDILQWRRAAQEINNLPTSDIGFHAVKGIKTEEKPTPTNEVKE